MMTNEEILKIALLQSSYDCGCRPEDFLSEDSIVTESVKNARARKYLPLPFACDMVSYGHGIVAQTSPALAAVVGEYIRSESPAYYCLETPRLHVLDEKLMAYGYKICFMAEYFLPDVNALRELPCKYEIRVLHKQDFEGLYTDAWRNALCEKRKELDMLAVGAYDRGELVGLAGCSADCESMYQIGVDVLPAYRRQGIASALTSRLASEILSLGKVPFYCCAWSNIASARNAVKSGFRPAWVEVTAREIGFVNEMNGIKQSS